MAPHPHTSGHPGTLADADPCAAPQPTLPRLPPPEPPSPTSTRLRIAIAAILLMGAALAGAAVVTRAPDHSRPVTSAEPITGALALRPDLVRDARWPFRANGGFADAAAPQSPAGDPPLDDAHLANPSAGSSGTALSLVREFYDRLPGDPAGATDLLDPTLLAGQRDRVAAAFATATAVQVSRTDVDDDGHVGATVEVTYPGGDRVVLNQVLHVATGTVPRIIGAELISARHLPRA